MTMQDITTLYLVAISFSFIIYAFVMLKLYRATTHPTQTIIHNSTPKTSNHSLNLRKERKRLVSEMLQPENDGKRAEYMKQIAVIDKQLEQ